MRTRLPCCQHELPEAFRAMESPHVHPAWRLIGIQAVTVCAINMVEICIPLQCATPVQLGGLGWHADEIGEVYGLNGICTLIFSIAAGHYAIEKVGLWRFASSGFFVIATIQAITPLVNYCAGSPEHAEFRRDPRRI